VDAGKREGRRARGTCGRNLCRQSDSPSVNGRPRGTARAIRRRGLPMRLYVDNGAAYRSRHLALVCAKLGVTLIHARPFQPQAKAQASYCTPFCRCEPS
jgi:transposase InsO family protein